MAGTPPVRHDATVRGEVVPRAEPTRTRPGDAASRRRASRIGGLVRLARRLGGRARRPAASAVGTAVGTAVGAARTTALPAAVAVATPVARAVAPVVTPVLDPVLRPVAPLAGALASPLAKVAGDPRRARPVVSLRVDGHDQPAVPEVLARLDRDGSGRLLVLVPASGGDERVWLRGVDGTGATYADRLAGVLGWSPVTVRYDGAEALPQASLALGALLQRVVDGWPVPPTRVVLLAEGDGGLLARGALGLQQPGPRPWTDLVTELVALGTPQLGADGDPAAGATNLATGVGRRLEQELAGLVVAGPEVLDVPPLRHVDYLLVSDRAVGRPHPAGRVLGGLLRWRQRARRVHDLFPTAERFEVDTRQHPLVNHPDVHDALLRWLA